MKWAIRDLLNPVVTRSLLYGADPFDLEAILKKIDNIKVRSGKQIQEVWINEWHAKIDRYSELRDKAEKEGNRISAREYAKMVTQCHYACFMINIEDLEHKTEIYNGLEESYKRSRDFRNNKSLKLELLGRRSAENAGNDYAGRAEEDGGRRS